MAISPLRTPVPDDLPSAVERVAEFAASRAVRLDEESAAPDLEVEALGRNGLLTAPFTPAFGGVGLSSGQTAARELPRCLSALGRASLPIGRLYEGHVNAIRLVETYGSAAQKLGMSDEARRGALFGVWAADDIPHSLVLRREGHGWRLEGRKIFCSGASLIRTPLITAKDEEGHVRLAIPSLPPDRPVDLAAWTAQGMRASLTGTVDFSGLQVRDDEIVGEPGDYHREPDFSGGAWRFLAVHLGGMEGLFEGVAIQTTIGRLRESVGGLPLYQVTYGIPGATARTPTREDLMTKKRPMFEYEHEVRIVHASDAEINEGVLGHPLGWDPEKSVEAIWVHPDADSSFMQTVSAAVEPALKDHIVWSAMKERPPLE